MSTFDPNESATRETYITPALLRLGWNTADHSMVEEYPIDSGSLRADYVLFGKDGLPLAVVEAKRTQRSPLDGQTQAKLYADALEARFGCRPMIFLSNGPETWFWDDTVSHPRRVSGFFTRADLEKLVLRRTQMRSLHQIPIDDAITNRYYQKAAIRAVCDHMEQGRRKHLLVMATGTGKTRTAASLSDVLLRGNHASKILFLADRRSLVRQACKNFKTYLPHSTCCNLCEEKEEYKAQFVFSTYPTILNAIENLNHPLYSPAYFDLIIIDESHRSIFKKYRTIFEYFDAQLVGLTATPKTDVDRNTYDFFELETGMPTFAYDYETAVNEDHVLVPYYNYEVKTQFLTEGITYDQLSEEDKERFDDAFIEDDTKPDYIPPNDLNKFIFNVNTVNTVLQDLMERGIKVCGGERIGKTIIFAQSIEHADFIIQCFNNLYPKELDAIQRAVCEDSHAQKVIDHFEIPDAKPYIAVSVDMMDTGIDVEECVNLVFFKKVRSKTKFWQMIGRGTRLCSELTCVDAMDGEYTGKRRFLIFDYCGNFEYFREHKDGYETKEVKSLAESIFQKQIRIASLLQLPEFRTDDTNLWREQLVSGCCWQIATLNRELTSVNLHRQAVEKYSDMSAFEYISDSDKITLLTEIAPLVVNEEQDEYAKRFDNFMYGLMLTELEQMGGFEKAKRHLIDIAWHLEARGNIAQITPKLPLIREIQTDAFWDSGDILRLEHVRTELRELIKLIVDETPKGKESIILKLTDPVIDMQEGEILDPGYDFTDYRLRVNQYITDHADEPAIFKLTHNQPLNAEDYRELERVFTDELGSTEDYRQTFGETPFGLLIRRIAKLDHTAAEEAFSAFINDHSLNHQQIEFVHKIIRHMEQNGYMDSPAELMKPPFTMPVGFMKLFDQKMQTAIVDVVKKIRENAEKIGA